MSAIAEVAIIGAGPYGLSLASHLRTRGTDVRVFGFPMQTWRESMPVGMKLKSEGFASNLSDPENELTLEAYCTANGIPYSDTGLPVNVETFAAYGEAFQKRFIPDLERKMVVSVEPAPYGFDLHLDDAELVAARRVVVASGIRAFDYTPPELRGLPREFLTHSVAYGDAAHLSGCEVVVIGSGASATDVAALLRARGAKATIVTRQPNIRFQSRLGERSLYEKITAPMTGLGPGWKSVLCVKAPLVFHALPERFRVDVVQRYLGPAPAWFVREKVEGHVPYITRSTVMEAVARHPRVRLVMRDDDGRISEISADHVVAATGYRVDVDRLTFLSERIRSMLHRTAGAPVLSLNFESSVPHLYFVGTAAANSFGPMMRFAYGAAFAARRLSRHLTAQSQRQARHVAKVSSTVGALSGQLEQTSHLADHAKVRLLFVALVNNVGCERVIAEMSRYGSLCAVMSPRDYYCATTRAVAQHYSLPKLRSVWFEALFVRRRLEAAAHDWRPTLVVPLDDIAAWLLRSLAVDQSVSQPLRDLLIRSFGSPSGYSASINRGSLMGLASKLGVHKPNHQQLANVAEGFSIPDNWDFPLFLKTEHSGGGDGVSIVHDAVELARELKSRRSPSLRRRLTSWAKGFLRPMAGFRETAEADVIIQSFAPGVPAFRSVAAWNGRVIAGVSFAAERIHPEPNGASTVVRLIENREMDEIAVAMTAALGCSGFVSYDFMLDEEQGRAALIEMNPRCVGSCHLGGLFGHDICGALVSELSGSPIPSPSRLSTKKLVALFPKELERDPSGQYLHSSDVIHDVPRDDPALIAVYLRRLRELHPTRADALSEIFKSLR